MKKIKNGTFYNKGRKEIIIMSRLNKVLYENSVQAKGKSKKEKSIPQYSANGKVKRTELSRKKKTLLIVMFCFSVMLMIIYVPAILNTKKNNQQQQGYMVDVNYSSIKLCNEEISKNTDSDFDNDGIDNTKEQTEGTNIYSEDSDFDGATDYYELYVSKTDPNYYDTSIVVNIQKQLDNQEDKTVSSPYKMGNVILWADDYVSKAAGGVVETVSGYHFYNFSGYAQFPSEKGSYVYGVKNNIHTQLKHLEAEDAWKIDGYENVEVYEEKLKDIVEFSFFHKVIYTNSNVFTRTLATILPNTGWITATKKTSIDVEPDSEGWTTCTIDEPDYNYEDTGRFSKNTNSLQDLQYVRQMIQNNRCVAVSLFDSYDGEYIGIVYGYDKTGNFLIADPETKTLIGKLYVTEIGRKILNKEGQFVYSTIFAWNGLGFSSKSGDRISFFAVSGVNDGLNEIMPETEMEQDSPATTTEETTEQASTETIPEDNIQQEMTLPEISSEQQIDASPDLQSTP